MRTYDRESLVRALSEGRRFEFLPFYGHTPRADGQLSEACFSQWWRCEFEVNGVRYSSAEQFMMAEKARCCGDERTLQKILSTNDPSAVKALGREVTPFDAAKWDARRFDAVTGGNVAKFGSTPELKAFLLGTGERVLVEAAPRDTIWGVGLGRDNPNISRPEAWRGRNLLGFALMRARDVLRG